MSAMPAMMQAADPNPKFLSWSDTMKKNDFQLQPGDWASVTLRRLADASEGMNTSARARSQNDRKKKVITNEGVQAAARVSQRLRKKVAETRGLKRRLEDAYSDLTGEFEQMMHSFALCLDLLQRQNQPLKNTKFRLLERKKVPAHLEAGDKVQDALAKELNEITTSISSLVLTVADAESVLQRMDACRARLRGDISLKTAALGIDESCLLMPPPSDASLTPTASEGALVLYSAGGSAPAAPSDCNSIDTRNAVRNSRTFPEEWKRNSEGTIETAVSLTDESVKLRKRMFLLATRIVRNNVRFNEQTRHAFAENLRKVTRIRTQVAEKRERVASELTSAHEGRLSLENALREQEVPLTHCVQRLNLRKTRPGHEATRDAAEHSLTAQLGAIKSHIRDLEGRLAAAMKKEKELASVLKSLDSEVRDKDFECELDVGLLASESLYVMGLEEVVPQSGVPEYDQLLTHFRAIQASGSNKLMHIFGKGGSDGSSGAGSRAQTPNPGSASPLIASHSVRQCCHTKLHPSGKAARVKLGRTSARLAQPHYAIRPHTALR